jgi:hypothetical protein
MTIQTATLACPMCEYECDQLEDFRFHLHTRHSKSDLVQKLVETRTSADADVVTAY